MQQTEPRTFRWTREHYYFLAENNIFLNQRVELIDGEILEMGTQNDYHAAGVELAQDALRGVFGKGYRVRNQANLDLSPTSSPSPDLAVTLGSPKGVTAGTPNPTGAMLVVEVSDSTLAFDRNRKSSLYAAAGIGDYWIVNLVDRQLEIYRNPVADETKPFGYRYADRFILDATESAAPLAVPEARVAVADLLP